MRHHISIYFFHAGKGQSIAVRLWPNSWIVVDAEEFGPEWDLYNPALELLLQHQEQEDFRLLAMIVSHFHLDHYGGMETLIHYFFDQVEAVLVPVTIGPFERLIRTSSEFDKGGRLEHLLDLLAELGPDKVSAIDALNFVIPVHEGKIESNEPWMFCFHPRQEDVVKAFADEGYAMRRRKVQTPTLEYSWIQDQANAYSYVFSVGWGRSPKDMHLLLTADIARKSFLKLTDELERLWIPKAVAGTAGAHGQLLNLLVDGTEVPEARRLRPIQGLSVPHHGSAGDLIRVTELKWWLGQGNPPLSHRPIAVVQGDRNAFRSRTFQELGEAGFQIFASARPARIELENVSKIGVETGTSASMLVVPESWTKDYDRGFLALHGGAEGLRSLEARDFYGINWPSGEIEHHRNLRQTLTPEV